ncbi:MAG: biosynthetic-type acetolactate synthase large subunit [Candidatus Levyibacteriota bacterium]|nr:MAG: biosynthetic-type acetolactate synthase large subunit [Candidatus Levybacteria bacterium]
MKQMSGGHMLMETFLKEGVDLIFGYPGGAIMPVYNALYDYRGKIRHILVRHEQGASHAAEGYARITGKPGVCLATSGPGATNLITGITDALMDSVPLVCITGQVASHLVGTDAFQEADIVGMTTPITKWNYQITKAYEIVNVIAKAFSIAKSGRPGPVLIDITKDAQIDTGSFSYKPYQIKKTYLSLITQKNNIKKAADLLNNAKRPYVLIGHGVQISYAEKELLQFVEKGGFPTAATIHGLSSLPANHPLYVGMLGMHGNYGSNILTNKADVIIAIGMRFDDRVTGRIKDYAPQAKIVHVDIDQSEHNKIIKTALAIVGDAKEVLRKLIPLIKKNSHAEWIKEFRKCDAIEYEKAVRPEMAPTTPLIKMAEVIAMLSKKTNGQSIIVADVGQHQMMAARYYKFQKPKSFITSGGLGTMGFALPASIGVKLASPKRNVIAVIGDGSFQMTIQELATITQEKLPVKIILLNNNYLGMVRQWQELFFDRRYSFVDLDNPDFIQVAKGFRIPGLKVEKRKDLAKGVDKMLLAKTPFLLEVHVEKEGNVFPMMPTGASVEEIRLE